MASELVENLHSNAKNYPFSKQNTIILIALSLESILLFSPTPKEMGKFLKFDMCNRNTIYCQTETGKLKLLEEIKGEQKTYHNL